MQMMVFRANSHLITWEEVSMASQVRVGEGGEASGPCFLLALADGLLDLRGSFCR